MSEENALQRLLLNKVRSRQQSGKLLTYREAALSLHVSMDRIGEIALDLDLCSNVALGGFGVVDLPRGEWTLEDLTLGDCSCL